MIVSFANHFYKARTLPLSAQSVKNAFTEIAPMDAKAKAWAVGSPGLDIFANVGVGPIRALPAMAGVQYVVSGLEVYKVTSAGVGTKLGDITGTGAISVADSGAQLVIVSGGKGYVCDGVTVAEITDPDFPLVSCVTYMDGYFVFSKQDSDQFIISALKDATTYDALDYATAEKAPDQLVGCIVDHAELWLVGKSTIEVWYNSGDPSFPFDRISGAVMERGCKAASSIAKMDNSVFWLGDDGMVYRAQGYVPQRISTHAIEHLIEDEPAPENIRAWTYTQEGHSFYVMTSDTWTLVYDAATQLWHERESADLGRWRVECVSVTSPGKPTRIYGKLLVGDGVNGKIYALDLDHPTEDGVAIRREATSAPIHVDTGHAIMDRLTLEFETGVGIEQGQGENPQVMLRWSDDGGRTWSNEIWRPLGRQGEYGSQVTFERLGQFKNRVLKIAMTDPVTFALLGIAEAAVRRTA